jgi:putative nucleotidyltransferase with HDIG domain
MKRTIRLRGMSGGIRGRTWESSGLMRIGRLEPLEVVLEDSSVSRYHAEIRATDQGWRVRDLGSTNGTRLNGMRLGEGANPLHVKDVLQCGEVMLLVEAIVEQPEDDPNRVVGTETEMLVEATSRSSWDEALEQVAFDSNHQVRQSEQLLALLRASQNLVKMDKEEDLLSSILEDAVKVLDAQRGAIVMVEGPEQQLKLRAMLHGKTPVRLASLRDPEGRGQYSQSLALRCVSRGESILCQKVDEDDELAMARSIAEGTMASVLCVLLRTPRKRLGILHLDRGPWQKPFTPDDLRLADGLAANVSAGIECAQLLRKQRDLFLDTITILAQAVEMRDEYTGGHTQRVTAYSVMLGEHMGLAPNEMELIRLGTPLHDIGKIGIDDAILRKPDKLTPEEFEVMKTHTTRGAEILQTIADLQPIIPIVRSHHERWDGLGYPDGLVGENIPHLARIVALADAYDAMTSDRPYRKGMSPVVAFGEIEKMLGKQFDPNYARGFLELKEAIVQEMAVQASQNNIRKGKPASTAVIRPTETVISRTR